MQVELRKRPEVIISQLVDYITEEGSPQNATNYYLKIVSFLESLSKPYPTYPVCKYPAWAKRKWRCAVFDKKYVVAFRVEKNKIIVFKFLHGSILSY
jgi:plasmid stabilization system protein ParE